VLGDGCNVVITKNDPNHLLKKLFEKGYKNVVYLTRRDGQQRLLWKEFVLN